MQIINVKPKNGPADAKTIPCGNCGERMDLKKTPAGKRYVCRKKGCGLSCAPQLAMVTGEVFRG